MAYGDLYQVGTATLDGGDASLVEIAGALLLANAVAGDTFELAGRGVTIAEVIDNENIRLAYDWPDSAFIGVAYAIIQDAPQRNPTIALARNLRDQYERLRIFNVSKPIFGVVEFGVNTPPEDYAVGDMLVVGSSPTGDFSGRANAIARFTEESTWFIQTPEYGWHVISQDDPNGANLVRSWDGSAWVLSAGLAAGIEFVGEWDSGDTYTNGRVVKHNFKLWIALAESTNEEPGTAPDYWIEYVIPGEHGGVPIALAFSTDTTSSEPASGGVKLNNATPGDATVLRISKTDLYGGNRAAEIAWIGTSNTSTQKGRIRLQKIGSVEDFRAIVMTVTEQTNSYDLSISSPSAPNGFFDNADPVLFYFDWRGQVGATGGTGATGARGAIGGPVAIPLVFSIETGDADPGNGAIRLDNATQNLATTMRVDLLDSVGATITSLLDSLATASTSTVKANARLVATAAPETSWLTFNITAVASPTGYRNITIAVTGQSASSPFTNGQAVTLQWVAKGDKGDQGEEGPTGPDGAGLDFDLGPVADNTERDALVGVTPGQRVAVSDIGTGQSAVYQLVSDEPYVWSDPILLTAAAGLANLVEDTTPQLGGTLDTNAKQIRWSKGADVASGSTLTLGDDGNYFDITGTTTITAIATKAVGTVVKLHFDAALTLTHNATDLILPGGANITTAAGDEAEFVEYASGDWRCVSYVKASGKPVVANTPTEVGAMGQGKHTISIPASAMRPRATNGCASLATLTLANGHDFPYLAFDPSTGEFATFPVAMPKGWNEGTISFRPRWSHPSTTTNFGVLFGIRARAISDGEAMNFTAISTGANSVDTGGTTDYMYTGPESSAYTIEGSPAEGDLVLFEVYRAPTDGSDTLAVDARLHNVEIFYTINAATDA